jgi:dipeptidyl aminopeptidase/acylaminoacyl peptidase
MKTHMRFVRHTVCAALAPLILASSTAAAAAAAVPARTDSLGIRDLLDVSTVAISDLSPDGRWLAVTVSSRRDGLGTDFSRDGDPTYLRSPAARVLVIDTKSGAQRAVWTARKTVRALTWSGDGTRLAMLVLENDALQVMIWDRVTGKFTAAKLPAGQYAAENSELRWSDDGRQVAFAARSDAWRTKAKARFAEITKGPIVALDGKDDFLEWDAMNRMNEQRAIVAWDPATGAMKTLLAEQLVGQWTLSKDGSAITVQADITKKTDYDVIGGREWKLVTQSTSGGEARTVFPTLKGVTLLWAEDGKRFASGRDGRVYVGSIADTVSRQLLGPPADARGGAGAAAAASADTSAEARARRGKERFTAVRWSPAGNVLLASNSEGLWLVDVASGTKEMIQATPDSTSLAPRTQFTAWSQDGRYLYFSVNSRTKWERAIARYDRQTGQRADLVKDARLYSGLRLSKDGSTAVLAIADGNHVADVYVADASLGGLRRIVESNPQLAQKPIAKTELISYMDADGKSRYGVLHLPVGYEKGKRYPTVFIIYEDFFDDTWDAVANLLSAHGYAVVKPSVGFEIGYPGEAWLKSVTAAANAVIAMGVADSSRLGVQGQSYGGYATNLIVTQTHRFAAAINVSGKVDIISFYTDSPRLGVRNIHAAEKSQDRIGATLWQQPQKYVQHSAVMFADRITTPLLLLTGGQDHNVPELNTREMYYAMRRLGKTVSWVSYTNGGHGAPTTTEGEIVDWHQRILDWYAKYLGAKKAAAASDGSRH